MIKVPVSFSAPPLKLCPPPPPAAYRPSVKLSDRKPKIHKSFPACSLKNSPFVRRWSWHVAPFDTTDLLAVVWGPLVRGP